MIITAVCKRVAKMLLRAFREGMFLASVTAMFFKFALCVSKFLAVITSNDFNSLLYEVQRSVFLHLLLKNFFIITVPRPSYLA